MMNSVIVSKATCVYLLVTLVVVSLDVASHTTQAKTWSLENTPKEFRPGLCASVRKQLAYDLGTQSYKTALRRKAEGKMWRQHEKRLSDVAGVKDTYRRLNCKAYP